jgi:hypothetical protein
MKSIGRFIFHVCIAALAVPMLTLLVAALGYSWVSRFFSAVTSPQMFYSEHFIFVAALVGACLAYTVSEVLTDRGAVWVWVPFTLLFMVRVLTWKESFGVHSSTFGHFFTQDCQIQSWPETDFAERCGDKLFLTQLFIGSMAYSIGALIHIFADDS